MQHRKVYRSLKTPKKMANYKVNQLIMMMTILMNLMITTRTLLILKIMKQNKNHKQEYLKKQKINIKLQEYLGLVMVLLQQLLMEKLIMFHGVNIKALYKYGQYLEGISITKNPILPLRFQTVLLVLNFILKILLF